MSEILYKEESFKIIGLCMEIHKQLGSGLKEMNYKDALEFELKANNFLYEREKRFAVKYKEQVLPHPYIVDFIVMNKIILEIKSAVCIADVHLSQTLRYIKVANVHLGMVINFGEKSLTWKWLIF